MTLPVCIFVINLASTLFLTGLIWTVQWVHYPLFVRVGPQAFAEYHRDHMVRMTAVVAVPMLVELVSAVLLLVSRPPAMKAAAAGAGCGLVTVIWLSTVFLQVPRHQRLAERYLAVDQSFLTLTNWIRTLAWSARSVLLLFVLSMLLID